MPRVILRTVEPANELACQSVEKRCTRAKESRATSDMICSVNGTIACKPVSRRIIDISPSATMAPNAMNAACRAAGSSAPRVRASTRWPENTGMNRSAMVAPSKPPATMAVRPGWFSQWRNTNGITTRIAAGRFLDRTVMASSGYASRARRLHLMDARAAAGRTHASLKETLLTRWEAWGSGRQARSMPAEDGAQEARSPGESIERGRTICEYIEIMHILPGSSDNALLINASQLICNITTKSEQTPGDSPRTPCGCPRRRNGRRRQYRGAHTSSCRPRSPRRTPDRDR